MLFVKERVCKIMKGLLHNMILILFIVRRELVHKFRHRTLMLLKLLMIQKKVQTGLLQWLYVQ